MKKTIAITGASGFIGRGIALELFNAGHDVICLTRQINEKTASPYCRWKEISDYTNSDEVAQAIAGAHLVIHLADDPDRVAKTRDPNGANMVHALIDAMRQAEVKRLVFASSIYARLDAEGHPSAYGAHKRSIEDVILAAKDIKSVILRLPPVYGPGCRGGVAMLISLIQRGLPIPAGRAHAPRVYLALSNLVDLIRVLADTQLAKWNRGNGIYEPSDRQPISTRSLVVSIGKVMDITPKIISLPAGLAIFLARLLGKKDAVTAAFTPLHLSTETSLEKSFGWTPPHSIPATLQYLSNSH